MEVWVVLQGNDVLGIFEFEDEAEQCAASYQGTASHQDIRIVKSRVQ